MCAWIRCLMAGLLLLCACAVSPGIPAVLPAQIPLDLTGAVMILLRIQPVIVMTAAGAFTAAQKHAMETGLNKATRALGTLSAGMPADRGAQLVQEIDAAVDETVGILTGVIPFAPRLAKWLPVIDAVDAVLPDAERFVDERLGLGRPVRTGARRLPAMTPDQARQALGIRVIPR